MSNVENTHSYTGQFAAAMMRLIVMHKTGGALDVAHASDSDYVGSATMGNFLYGANARAMGFTESGILRGAAFYQPISENGWSSVPEGIYNFITNSGDNPGDPEQTLRGIRYHDEVFMNNQTDSSSTSCLDLITVSQGDTSSPGSGGGSGDTGGGSGDTGGGTGGEQAKLLSTDVRSGNFQMETVAIIIWKKIANI